MRVLAFAARSLVRQPGRTALGILGVAAVGALLFDMLLLSRGLLVSLRNVLDASGFDVRVMATDSLPLAGPRLRGVTSVVAAARALPEVEDAVAVSFTEAQVVRPGRTPLQVSLTGVGPSARKPWTLVDGKDLGDDTGTGPPPLLVNRNLARALGMKPGDDVMLRGEGSAAPPVAFRMTGIATFPFDETAGYSAVARREAFQRVADTAGDEADLILAASRPLHGAAAAVAAIRAARPEVHPFSNAELVERFQALNFSYFRQISTVLSTITLFFGFLLTTVLLTVSVNQRFAEIAALRALGLSRGRVAADIVCQSAFLVGAGGALSLPLGLLLATWLDSILRSMPEIPAAMHFFVFEPRALWLHAGLLTVTALLAAAYPVRLVARLPIAATLRNEAVT